MGEHRRHPTAGQPAVGTAAIQPQPTGTAAAANRTIAAGSVKPRLVDDVWFRIGVVAGAVGALLLVTHYFEPFLLLGALPVKSWRAAA